MSNLDAAQITAIMMKNITGSQDVSRGTRILVLRLRMNSRSPRRYSKKRAKNPAIIKNVARIPKPATAMIKNNRMFRIVVSSRTAASNGPCMSRQV